MSLPKPSADMKNSRIPIGSAETRAAMAKKSSSAKFLVVIKQRAITPTVASPPETPVTIGVICVMSLTATLHIVCVLF